MKKLLITFLLLAAGVALAETEYGNIVSGQKVTTLPKVLHTANGDIINPTAKQYLEANWRIVQSYEQPAQDWAVSAYTAIGGDIDGTNCQMKIVSQYNLWTKWTNDCIAAQNWINTQKTELCNNIASDPRIFGLGFYICSNMVANGIAANMGTAKQMVLDKMFSQISTNMPPKPQ